MSRPPLPTRHANPHVREMDPADLPPVKYQILNCQGKDILVGRMKIETPTSGHAFILRRFDTGAVSLTTMFRAAFPSASEEEEKREVTWVKGNYDLSGNNGSSKEPNITRLAGTWVSPTLAVELGQLYNLAQIIMVVVNAQPDPNGSYRRSGKSSGAKPETPSTAPPPQPMAIQSPTKTLPTPSPPDTLPGPAKRRKESSPSPAQPPPVPASIRATRSPTPRRSTRVTKSPPARSAPPIPSIMSVAKPKDKVVRTVRKEEVVTPAYSDETAVDEEVEAADDIAGSELRQQDIAEQREMIEGLKAQRDACLDGDVGDGAAKLKRNREETEALQFDFKEPEVGERALASNRRISSLRLEPRQKSFAWGVAAFAVGLGAVTLLPNFF